MCVCVCVCVFVCVCVCVCGASTVTVSSYLAGAPPRTAHRWPHMRRIGGRQQRPDSTSTAAACSPSSTGGRQGGTWAATGVAR